MRGIGREGNDRMINKEAGTGRTESTKSRARDQGLHPASGIPIYLLADNDTSTA